MTSNLSFPVFGGPTIGLVVPSFPDRDAARDMLTAIPDLVHLVTCFDDGTDPALSEEIARQAERDLRIYVIDAAHSKGNYTAAAFRFAVDAGADVVASLPPGHQISTATLDMLLAPVIDGEADVAKAAHLPDPLRPKNMTVEQMLALPMSRVGARFASGYWNLTDPNADFIAIHGMVVQRLPLDTIPDDGRFFAHLLNHLGRARVKLVELSLVPASAPKHDAHIGIVDQIRTGLSRLSWEGRVHGHFGATTRLICAAFSALVALILLPGLAQSMSASDVILSPTIILLVVAGYFLRRFVQEDARHHPECAIHAALRAARTANARTIGLQHHRSPDRQAQIEEMILLHSVEKTIH